MVPEKSNDARKTLCIAALAHAWSNAQDLFFISMTVIFPL
jgi:hypothetical protein